MDTNAATSVLLMAGNLYDGDTRCCNRPPNGDTYRYSKMEALLTLQAAYMSAYNAAPPHTYPGRALITARNQAEKAFKEGIRLITAQYIRNNDALTDYQKELIGLPITATTGTGKHTTSTAIVE